MTNKNLQNLLDTPVESEHNLEEDLMIIQPDGTRACLNWELRGKGYQILTQNYEKKLEEMSDEELLKSAYSELKTNSSQQ